jgi:hypothetical protein
MAAIIHLHPSHTVHWHAFQMSVPDVVMIILMLVLFILAIALPFPGALRRRGGSA